MATPSILAHASSDVPLLKWAVSMETRQLPLMMALMKWHPLITLAPLSLREGGWVGRGCRERQTEKYGDGESERQLFHTENESHSCRTGRISPSWSRLPGADSDRNTMHQMMRESVLSHIGADMTHTHMPCWFMCHKKVSSNICALAVRLRDTYQQRIMHHHLLHSFIYFFRQISLKISVVYVLTFRPLFLQSFYNGDRSHCNFLYQHVLWRKALLSYQCMRDPVASGVNCLWFELSVIHHCCATSSNNQILLLAILTEFGSDSSPPSASSDWF